jgi:uncharacterized damage-inducible protein DinB
MTSTVAASNENQQLAKLVDDLLEAYRYTREGVIAEVENLPAAAFAERPKGMGRSALELALHIVESGRLMAGELSRRDGDFQRKPYPDLVAEHSRSGDQARSKEEAVELLRRSYQEDDQMLRTAGVGLLLQPIRQFNGVYATRLSWLHHGVAHEEYHRGQLALYARLFGVKPALTKLIEGE